MADATITDAQLRARARAITVGQREQQQRIVTARTRRALTAEGKVRVGSTDAISGAIRTDTGGTGHDRGAEPPLGLPDGAGYLLTSDPVTGARAWIPLVAGAGIALGVDPTTGAITISATGGGGSEGSGVQWGGAGLAWDGDSLQWGS